MPLSESYLKRLLAKQIRNHRRTRKWSQEKLAERASIQRSYIADLERGARNPSVRTLLKLANAFGIPIRGLFEFGDTK